MKSYFNKINKETANNENFRKVLFTSELSQLVVMCLKSGEEIGMEVHNNIDQFIRVESGQGTAVLNGQSHELGPRICSGNSGGCRTQCDQHIERKGAEALYDLFTA